MCALRSTNHDHGIVPVTITSFLMHDHDPRSRVLYEHEHGSSPVHDHVSFPVPALIIHRRLVAPPSRQVLF